MSDPGKPSTFSDGLFFGAFFTPIALGLIFSLLSGKFFNSESALSERVWSDFSLSAILAMILVIALGRRQETRRNKGLKTSASTPKDSRPAPRVPL